MAIRHTLRRTSIFAVFGALMVTGLGTQASAGAAPTPAVKADKGDQFVAQFGSEVSARKASARYSRTSGHATEKFTFTVLRGKKVVGLMTGTVNQPQTLNAKSRQWKRQLKIKINSTSGVLKGGASISVKISCGKGTHACRPSKAVKGKLRKGRTFTAGWKINSPNNGTNTHRPVPVATLTGGGGTTTASASGMASVRCDKIKYLGKPGCVYPGHVPNFSISRNDSKVNEAASHIYAAERKLKGKPGYSKPLHRITSKSQMSKNRNKACPKKLHRPKGKSCDEYPMASTREGAATGIYSRKMINAKDNSRAGSRLGTFYSDNRIVNGDAFWARIK